MACIAISGYYGFYNTGDEAILEVIISILRRRIPGAEIVVFSADPDHTSKAYGVESVSRTHLPSVMRTLKRADLLISGGGGLLQDITSFRSVAYYLGIMEVALCMGKKVAVFAQGMGPLRHPLALRWVKRVLNRVDLVSVRDSLSASFLGELGIKNNVRITADPVFSLKPASREEIEAFWKKEELAMRIQASRTAPQAGDLESKAQASALQTQTLAEKKPLQIGVALRPFPHKTYSGAEIFDIITEACLYLEREYDASFIFLPYQLKKDLPISREIAARLSRPSVVIERALTVREVISLIGGLDLLLGMRLHALIFSAISGVSFIPLPYDPKINAFLSRLEKDLLPSLEDLTLDQLIFHIEMALSEKGLAEKVELASRIEKLRDEVERSALELVALVSGAGKG